MKAHELIKDPKNWTQGVSARDKGGKPISSKSDEAVCFCMLGAIWHCYEYADQTHVMHLLFSKLGGYHVAEFNDLHTHEEVYNLLKELDI